MNAAPAESVSDVHDAFSTYLRDHHASSVVTREMIRCAVARHAPDSAFFVRLDQEIGDDQSALETMIKRTGAAEGLPGKAGVWLSEQGGHFQTGDNNDPQSHLQLLETLLLRVRGKLALWEALGTLPVTGTVIEGMNIAGLITRVRRQLEKIEDRRRAAFARLGGGVCCQQPV